MKPHRGSLVLVYGILGFIFCPLFGPAAWSMGTNDLKEMAAGRMDRAGKELTKAGRICGMIATGILAIQILFLIVIAIILALGPR